MVDYQLDDYQIPAFEALLSNEGSFGLFDEQGVGKTPPSIMASLELKGPTLVTAPAYLLPTWERTIKMFAPHATVSSTFLANGADERTRLLAQEVDFVLTSYHSWAAFAGRGQLKYPALAKRGWSNYVFDESQRLRGRNSLWTQQVFKVRNVDSRNRHVPMWHLTGTPLVRDAGDIWPFLYLCSRDEFRSYWSFVEEMCYVTDTPWERVVGHVRNPEIFARTMRRFSMRRLLKDIPQLSSLESIDEPEGGITVPLPKSVYALMREAKKNWRIELEGEVREFETGGALVQMLRQLTTTPPTQENPKVDALLDLLSETNERVVIFCWYRQSVETVRSRIAKRWPKRKVVTFTGDTSARNKDLALQEYDKTDDCVLIATISALKEGANLQAGRRVIFLEHSDLPSENEQCVSRLKRRGQTQTVLVTHLTAANSPDTVVMRNAAARKQGIERAMLDDMLEIPDMEEWGW